MSTDDAVIDLNNIDHAELIGRDMVILSQQFPGKPLKTRVVGVSGNSLLVDRSGSSGLVNQLINNQPLEISLIYKGEPVTFSSKTMIPHKGRLQIPLADRLFPELTREFPRVPYKAVVNLACFTENYISTVRLNKLKWFKTATINISGGGSLMHVSSELNPDFYMILNLGLENIELPRLILARVRHCNIAAQNKFTAGVQFVIKENLRNQVSNDLVKHLPRALFEFTESNRQQLAAYLIDSNGCETI